MLLIGSKAMIPGISNEVARSVTVLIGQGLGKYSTVRLYRVITILIFGVNPLCHTCDFLL